MTVRPAILATAIMCACCACSPAPDANSPAVTPATDVAAQPAPPSPMQVPTAHEIGIDLSGIDHAVKPGNDFFEYANGEWLKTATIPADRSSINTFYDVFRKAEQRTADLIKQASDANPAPDSNQRKIADYYAAYMNTDAIEKAGLAPIQSQLDKIDAINSRQDLARVLGSGLRADADPINNTNFHTEHLFGLFVTKGLEDPTTNIGYLLQGGLAMPSRDYYLSDDAAMKADRVKYQTYVAALLKQAGSNDADAQAKTIIALETKIAKAQIDLIDSENVHKANTIWNMTDFASKAPGLDWTAYFKAAGLDQVKQLDVWQAQAVTGLSALVAKEPLADWKTLVRFHTLDEAADLLPKAYADLHFDFYSKTLQGVPQQQPRWKDAVSATSNNLGDAVGQIYVSKFFPASSKTEVQQMVKNLLAAFDERIDTLDWMAPATKKMAKAKISTLHVSVGYPEKWRDYSDLEVKPDDALGNSQRAAIHEYDHQKAKIGTPIDRGEWWMTPQTVNAINLPLQNALNFPAAILEPPFFDPDADAAANYGSIGAVIGHEISHSFDNMGSEFDAQGNLHNWWTPADAAHFKTATDRLAKQFDQYEALPGLHVNGEQTLGENIADISGLTVALAAYHKSLNGESAPDINGLSGDQRFFIAFGQTWRSKMRDAALRQRVITNVHAPAQFRAQTVRNMDDWYKAFDVQPDQKLYLAPDQRVKIW